MRYIVGTILCLTAASAEAYTPGGTRIVVEGEVVAAEWVGGNQTGTWKMLVKHSGFLYSCSQSRDVVLCSRISG